MKATNFALSVAFQALESRAWFPGHPEWRPCEISAPIYILFYVLAGELLLRYRAGSLTFGILENGHRHSAIFDELQGIGRAV